VLAQAFVRGEQEPRVVSAFTQDRRRSCRTHNPRVASLASEAEPLARGCARQSSWHRGHCEISVA